MKFLVSYHHVICKNSTWFTEHEWWNVNNFSHFRNETDFDLKVPDLSMESIPTMRGLLLHYNETSFPGISLPNVIHVIVFSSMFFFLLYLQAFLTTRHRRTRLKILTWSRYRSIFVWMFVVIIAFGCFLTALSPYCIVIQNFRESSILKVALSRPPGSTPNWRLKRNYRF